jgi:hypothetical protein
MVAFAALTSPALAKPQSPGTASYAAHSCKGNAYREVKGTGGETFANTGQCVSYVRMGGTLVAIDAPPSTGTQSVTLQASESSYKYEGKCRILVNAYNFPVNDAGYLLQIVNASDQVVETDTMYVGYDVNGGTRGTRELVGVVPGTYTAQVSPDGGTTWVTSAPTFIDCASAPV